METNISKYGVLQKKKKKGKNNEMNAIQTKQKRILYKENINKNTIKNYSIF